MTPSPNDSSNNPDRPHDRPHDPSDDPPDDLSDDPLDDPPHDPSDDPLDDLSDDPLDDPPHDPSDDPLDDLFALYRSPSAQRLYDEVVTELDHALQAAAMARADGAPPELVAAALLHDVGHLVLDDNVPLDARLDDDAHHERAGSRYLTRWFGPEVTAPVALHVAAKRYLCTVEAEYHDALSPSSVRSLGVQGGPMTDREVDAFERNPHHGAAVSVRRWDDLAKLDGLDVPGFDEYEPLLRAVATR